MKEERNERRTESKEETCLFSKGTPFLFISASNTLQETPVFSRNEKPENRTSLRLGEDRRRMRKLGTDNSSLSLQRHSVSLTYSSD
jgi:hypothetical protein